MDDQTRTQFDEIVAQLGETDAETFTRLSRLSTRRVYLGVLSAAAAAAALIAWLIYSQAAGSVLLGSLGYLLLVASGYLLVAHYKERIGARLADIWRTMRDAED